MEDEGNGRSITPVITYSEASEPDGWDDPTFGRVQWWTLLSADRTPTHALTCGITEIGPKPDAPVMLHQHVQPEIYHILSGEGIVVIDGVEYPVRQGATVFIPGSQPHGARNTGQTPLRLFYVFAVDSFAEVTYEAAS